MSSFTAEDAAMLRSDAQEIRAASARYRAAAERLPELRIELIATADTGDETAAVLEAKADDLGE